MLRPYATSPLSLWLLYLSVLLITTAEGGMNTILPPYLDAAHYSVELIGIVTALFALLSLASRLPAGALYAGSRARRLIVAFTALYILSTSTFGISSNAFLIFPLTIIHGFAFGAVTTIMLPVAIQLRTRGSTASHGARMGWYTAALSAGYALGNTFSGRLADWFGFSFAFIAMGLLPLGTIALTLALPPIESGTSVGSAASAKSQLGWRQIGVLFSSASPMLLFATLIAFYINFLDDGFGTFFPLFGLGIGLTLSTIGDLRSLKSATGIVIRAFSGNLFRFINYRWLNHALVLGWSLVVFFLPDMRADWVFIAAFIFMGLARSLSRVTSATIVAEEKAHDAAGIGMASGIYNMGLDLGSLAGPLIAGFVARAVGIPTMMRVIPIMLVAIYFGALVWLNRATQVGPRRGAAKNLSGIVRSGRGEARGFTQLDWVRAQFIAKLGFEPYPGTLNLETSDGAASQVARSARGIIIEPAPNFCAARCYRVKLNGRVDAVWIVPEVADYPRGQMEFVAPVSLRDALNLKDGAVVTFQFTGDM